MYACRHWVSSLPYRPAASASSETGRGSKYLVDRATEQISHLNPIVLRWRQTLAHSLRKLIEWSVPRCCCQQPAVLRRLCWSPAGNQAKEKPPRLSTQQSHLLSLVRRCSSSIVTCANLRRTKSS